MSAPVRAAARALAARIATDPAVTAAHEAAVEASRHAAALRRDTALRHVPDDWAPADEHTTYAAELDALATAHRAAAETRTAHAAAVEAACRALTPRDPDAAGRVRLVIIESPYAGDVERNENYARAALADCLTRGEAPYASHLLYTQPGVLDDTIPAQRHHGIAAGLAWGDRADATVVYTDLGISPGMALGIEAAEKAGRPVERRTLPGWGG